MRAAAASLLICIGAGVAGIAAKNNAAQAQVRLFSTEKNDFEQRTHLLPWRQLQQDQIDYVNATNPCPRAGSDLSPRIIGGKAAPNCTFHDLVRIEFRNALDRRTYCSGVLLSDSHVLTAGHCACGKVGTYVIHRHVDRNTDKSIPALFKRSFVLARDPALFAGYVCNVPVDRQAGRDLALLTIEPASATAARLRGDAVPRLDGLGLVNVATPGQIIADSELTRRLLVAGYGETSDGSAPDDPHVAAIPIVTMSCARGQVAASLCQPFREFALASGLLPTDTTVVDSCVGDSGSPVFYMSSVEESEPAAPTPAKKIGSQSIMLVGITSRALRGVRHTTASQCGGGGIYTSVGHPDVVAWLRSFNVSTRSLLAGQDLSAAGGDLPITLGEPASSGGVQPGSKFVAGLIDFAVDELRAECGDNLPGLQQECVEKVRECLQKQDSLPTQCFNLANKELSKRLPRRNP